MMPDLAREVDDRHGPGTYAHAERFVLMYAGEEIRRDPELWDAESRVITDECAEQIAELVSVMVDDAREWLFRVAESWAPTAGEGLTWEEAAAMVRHSCD